MESTASATIPPSARRWPRREGQQRSVATRQRLLQATIDCIVEFGYAGTTTTMVAERADVSRGAQQHHYPTKSDLVVAAMDELATQADAAIRSLGTRVGAGQKSMARVLDLLFQDEALSTALVALIELDTGARTDPELRPAWRSKNQRISEAAVDLLAEIFTGKTPQPRDAAVVTAAYLVGMTVAASNDEPADRQARMRQAPKALLSLL